MSPPGKSHELLTANIGSTRGRSDPASSSRGNLVTGGEAVVRTLEACGVDVVFGIPGGDNIEIFEALSKSKAIRNVLPRHEQGAGFMADGYARTGGEPGVVICLEGPGLTNTLTALGEANEDSSPVLVITSQIASEDMGLGRGLIHELGAQRSVAEAVCLSSESAKEVGDIGPMISRAISRQKSERPAPAHVEIPNDILASRGEHVLEPTSNQDSPLESDALHRVSALIGAGPAPLILAGAGAVRSGCGDEITDFAERLGAPVLTTALGKGSIPEDHPLYLATLSLWSPWIAEGIVHDMLKSADPLIVIGSRLTDATTSNGAMPRPERLVQIDIAARAIDLNYQTDASVVGDARQALKGILDFLPEERNESWVSNAERDRARHAVRAHAERGMGWGVTMIDSLSAVLGPDTIITGDSLIGLWAATAWKTERARSYHVPLHFNTLGFALPAGMGAKLARPDAPVVALVGDGAFMYTASELAAAAQEQIPIVVIVCNDGGYESIRRQQLARFGNVYSSDLVSPDFVGMADALGAHGFKANGPEDFPSVLAKASSISGPTLIEIPLSVSPPWEI